jgi:hypothetical protein
MPRYGCGAIRSNSATSDLAAPWQGSVSSARGLARRFVRRAAFLVKASLVIVAALPFAHAQHGNSGGGSHSSAPHVSQPHTSPPHMSAPRGAPMQAPRPTFRGPAYSGPAYRGAPRPGYAPRPYPGVPNRFTPAPVPPGPPPAYRSGGMYPVQRPYGAPPSNLHGPHLGSWLQNHQGESFVGQENALRREPGFNRLPQPQQQRLIDRLHQLDSMPPQRRQRTLGRIENMERLSPEGRQQVRNSVQELNGMDTGRQQQVRGAFRALRELPPGQREQVLNSPAYRSMYSDHERQILGNLLSVEPYAPR